MLREYEGHKFRVLVERDDDMGPPWEEHDGHGVVSEWTSRNKYPGERILHQDRGSYRYYDFAETMKIAKRDRWGLGPEAMTELEQRLGRKPAQGEITAESVERDFEFLRRWCNDEWEWVWVRVELVADSSLAESLGGIDSDSEDYIEEVVEELMDTIIHQIERRTFPVSNFGI